MADQKTPAEVAAERIVADLTARAGINDEEIPIVRDHIVAAWTAIIAQATLDACEQAAPRVRAEERADVVEQAKRLARFASIVDNKSAALALNELVRVIETGAHVGLAGVE